MKLQWQNAAIIIGLIGGCISIPKSAVEAWQVMFSRPKLEVWKSAPASIKYDPQRRLLGCSFGILLHNTGTKAEVIHTLHAHLGIPDDPSRSAPFSDNDIILKEGANEVPKVLPIEQNMSSNLTCEITVTISDSLRGLFNQPETARELVLELVGEENRSYPATFHFDFSEEVAKTLFDPQGPPTRVITFIGSDQNE